MQNIDKQDKDILAFRREAQLYREVLAGLVREIELLFDKDWQFTLNSIQGGLIAPDATFLQTKQSLDADENNWANKAAFMLAYRNAAQVLELLALRP
jgi:hypothetical protein